MIENKATAQRRALIEAMLTDLLNDIGPERLSSMKLLELERLLRSKNANLGGKTCEKS
jgi:hypothetical protein